MTRRIRTFLEFLEQGDTPEIDHVAQEWSNPAASMPKPGMISSEDLGLGQPEMGMEPSEDEQEQSPNVGASVQPDKQGMIRTVKYAQLVSKRLAPDGTYTELWVFNCGKGYARDEFDVKKDILSATDIEPGSTSSEDGTQKTELWSCGNVQMLQIEGLPQ